MTKSSGSFARRLTPDQILYIETRTRPWMDLFGYSKSHDDELSEEDFQALSVTLLASEPNEKASYLKLDAEQRERAESWSTLFSRMRQRPPTSSSLRCLQQYEK